MTVVPTIITAAPDSGSDHEHSPNTTATPSKLRRRSRATRRSTGITPTEADLDTPDKIEEMGKILGTNTVADQLSDPLLSVPTTHVYTVPPPSPDLINKLTKELNNQRRRCEEVDCTLVRDLEELRRKDLNVRALEKTNTRLKSTLEQLEEDIIKLRKMKSTTITLKDENAALIRVIGKLSKRKGSV